LPARKFILQWDKWEKLDAHRKFFQIRIECAGGVEAVCRGEYVATTYNGSTTQLLPIQLHLYLQYIQAIQLFWGKNHVWVMFMTVLISRINAYAQRVLWFIFNLQIKNRVSCMYIYSTVMIVTS
jgi:hypothetical protein